MQVRYRRVLLCAYNIAHRIYLCTMINNRRRRRKKTDYYLTRMPQTLRRRRTRKTFLRVWRAHGGFHPEDRQLSSAIVLLLYSLIAKLHACRRDEDVEDVSSRTTVPVVLFRGCRLRKEWRSQCRSKYSYERVFFKNNLFTLLICRRV